MKRRNFINAGAIGLSSVSSVLGCVTKQTKNIEVPIVISTWKPNVKANAAAWKVLTARGTALDAVHQGVMIPEADENDQSVGYGGLPDRDGRVTTDAAIMDHLGNIGSVMCLEEIVHAITVARLVMEKTPHVQMVGEGALRLALEHGLKRENLLTEKSKMAWEKWLLQSKYDPMSTVDNILETIENQHDTIGMLALDLNRNLAGACTTSGMAYKMHGRVGDSPIIGAGLFVDNEIGAATASGVGEEIVRICGSHTVVELMRQGQHPENACRMALERLVKLKSKKELAQLQAGFIAIDASGRYGCYALHPLFTMAVTDKAGSRVIDSPSIFN